MTTPEFQPKLNSSGTRFVAVATGHGPASHIGDFLTEEVNKPFIASAALACPAFRRCVRDSNTGNTRMQKCQLEAD
jgi:hypothetical protein